MQNKGDPARGVGFFLWGIQGMLIMAIQQGRAVLDPLQTSKQTISQQGNCHDIALAHYLSSESNVPILSTSRTAIDNETHVVV